MTLPYSILLSSNEVVSKVSYSIGELFGGLISSFRGRTQNIRVAFRRSYSAPSIFFMFQTTRTSIFSI